ncbi:capsular biosynthesis protein [Caldimonas tepidiphila]|uniref:capsular biosynthesis protein n=1 Tax=Caldimonas tepidiphila TaxID=2315841 RepID=UPI000E5BE8AE|nr:capsular biosynthesis protein [Caldimonas tepidiphila]
MKFLSKLTPRRLQAALIGLPLVLGAAYFTFFAADRYVSESVVTVRQANQSASQVPGAALLLAGITPPSREDTLYLQRYIHSLDLLRKLDARLQLRLHYEGQTLDPFYRLFPGTSQEWFLEYYRSRVEVGLDDLSGLLSIRVQGFEPGFARQLNAAILEESEKFVNALSHQMAREQMSFAETELLRAGEKLQQAKARLLAFQNVHRVLDPTAQAQAAEALSAQLQGELSRQEAELKNALTYLNDDSLQVAALRNRIASLRGQLQSEQLRTTDARRSQRLNAQAAEFQDLQLQAGFAQDAYKLALSAVENARIDATRKLKSVAVIEPPSLAETADHPRRLYHFATLLVVCAMLYSVVQLAVATIRDHQD